jgi:hypothetical protein
MQRLKKYTNHTIWMASGASISATLSWRLPFASTALDEQLRPLVYGAARTAWCVSAVEVVMALVMEYKSPSWTSSSSMKPAMNP